MSSSVFIGQFLSFFCVKLCSEDSCSKMQKASFALGVGAGIGLYGVVYLLLQMFKSKKPKKPIRQDYYSDSVLEDCLLFSPVQSTYNVCSVKSEEHCGLISCSFCNYKKLISLIKSAQVHLDICVYLITSDEITSLLLSLFKRGVSIRIITDKDMSLQGKKTKLHVFLKERMQIRIMNTSDIMHNKFVLIDRRILVTGSLNWTKQGFTRNFENAIITSNYNVVNTFFSYFQYMWYDCSNR